MYSEHLRSKLRKAGMSGSDPAQQLFARAAAQVNTYVSIINARLMLPEDDDEHEQLGSLLDVMDRVETMAHSV
jgi:hypothetical protein